MSSLISIASGKGGVGKSFIASNLGYLLAEKGKRVVLADMDVGGADLHILFGIFKPKYNMGHFLQKDIKKLEEAIVPVDISENLFLLPGAGDTLETANPGYPAKKKLISNLRKLEADIVILDIGAGSHYHALDFFLMADHHLVVTNPEPTAIFDAYKFIKLASIRSALSYVMKRSDTASELTKKDFSSVEEILALLDESEENAKEEAKQAMKKFEPMLLINKSKNINGSFNSTKLRNLLKEYVGNDLHVLGEIPVDRNIDKTISSFIPLSMNSPSCMASKALKLTTHKLEQRLYQ